MYDSAWKRMSVGSCPIVTKYRTQGIICGNLGPNVSIWSQAQALRKY